MSIATKTATFDDGFFFDAPVWLYARPQGMNLQKTQKPTFILAGVKRENWQPCLPGKRE